MLKLIHRYRLRRAMRRLPRVRYERLAVPEATGRRLAREVAEQIG